MPVISEEVLLDCSPREAFEEIADLKFIEKIDPKPGLHTEVLFRTDRLVRYRITVDNVGSWESERLLLPETYTIVTQKRHPLAPFKYLVLIHAFLPKDDNKTRMKYIEELAMDEDNLDKEQKVFDDISRKILPNLKRIQDYFKSKSRKSGR